MKIFITLLLLMSSACAFKSNQSAENGHGGERAQVQGGLMPNEDSDGDFVKNGDELSLGRNPMVADIPELPINFLQNYKITADVKNIITGEITKISIDTKVGRNNPNFKYRVGELFVRGNALKAAASVGRFSSHSSGEIDEHDLTWFKYPDVDPSFYLEQVLKYKKYFESADFEIVNPTLTIENTATLKGNGKFHSIKNLKLNFYYYNYEAQNYELVATTMVARHFEAGITETFTVELSNLPFKLIEDNYFKKGEFIISEVADYEIEELNTTYATLLRSIKEKCVPVAITTPISTLVSYVALSGRINHTPTFSQILSDLYDKNVKIEEDRLTEINEWKNNLPDFLHLKEVAEQDKLGKWFIFTKPLKTTYLDHKFTASDVLVLSYVTGQELASQSFEKKYSYADSLSSQDSFSILPLGMATQNTVIDLELKPNKKIGEELGSFKESWISHGGSCGQNCITRDFDCEVDINLFKPLPPDFVLTEDSAEFKRMYLVIEHDELPLSELLAQKKIAVQSIDGNLHIKISDLEKIKEIPPGIEVNLALKLIAMNATTFHGVKLSSFTGRDRGYCIPMVTDFAAHFGFPLSVESAEFAGWRGGVNWNVVKLGENKSYYQGMEVAVTSVINNYFN